MLSTLMCIKTAYTDVVRKRGRGGGGKGRVRERERKKEEKKQIFHFLLVFCSFAAIFLTSRVTPIHYWRTSQNASGEFHAVPRNQNSPRS